MLMKRYTLLLCFLAVYSAASGQDPHLSQYYNTPLWTNPASTGNFNGNIRSVLNYRTQWGRVSVPFTTYSASFDSRFFEERLKGDAMGAGLLVLRDQSGTIRLSDTRVVLNLAYHNQLSEKSYLSFGAQGGILQKSYDPSEFKFSSQWNDLDFDQSIDHGEQQLGNYITSFDMNAGLMYKYMDAEKHSYYAGISFFHVNRPKQSLQNWVERLSMRTLIQVGGSFKVGTKPLFAEPGLLIASQNKDREIMLGSNLKYSMTERGIDLFTGLWYRNVDALITYFGFGYKKWQLGFSYDINISSLSAASNGQGGFELSLIYNNKVIPGKSRLKDDTPYERMNPNP